MMGLLGSIHCLGMCAPLSSLFFKPNASTIARLLPLLAYHLTRLLSYSGLGFILATLGISLTLHVMLPITLPLAIIPLLLYVYRGELHAPRVLARLQARLIAKTTTYPALVPACTLGLLTPLLPCGLLYGVTALALTAPSPRMGASWLFAFGLGTIPLLFTGQWGIHTLRRYLPPHLERTMMRVIALIAASTLLFFAWYHTDHQ